MHSLRNRLIAAFLVATLLPLGGDDLDHDVAARAQPRLCHDRRARRAVADARRRRCGSSTSASGEALKQDAAAARVAADVVRHAADRGALARGGARVLGQRRGRALRRCRAPAAITSITCARAGGGVDVYSRDLGGIHMQELSAQLRQARELVGSIEARDLRRGFTLTLLLLVAIVWLVSLAPLSSSPTASAGRSSS